MEGWRPDAAPGFGWPLGERTWINPSPNAPNLWMARAYAGTVMLEGTTLSEGRGTTRPLELFGAPDIDARAVMTEMQRACAAVARRAAACANAGSSRRFTSMSASFATACRSTPKARLRSRGVQALAPPGARLQGDPPPVSGLSAVARFPLRIRARQARHRRDQRRPVAARMGRRCDRRRRRTWTRWRCRTSRPGRASVSHTCATENRRTLVTLHVIGARRRARSRRRVRSSVSATRSARAPGNERSALVVQAEKARRRERSGAQRVLQRRPPRA